MIHDKILKAGWFDHPGAYVLVDGQFGSTGKGLLAGVLAEAGGHRISHVTTNAGPNSGHTAWLKTKPCCYERVMTQQVPIASIALNGQPVPPRTYLNAGAIIDPNQLMLEAVSWLSTSHLVVHPAAAIIQEKHRQIEATLNGGCSKIASTAKGVGAALADKIMREGNIAHEFRDKLPGTVGQILWDWGKDVVFVETAQGFSLGLNGMFYPHVTSRECTVMQAIADARIPWSMVRGVAACYRTYPIRVGNTENGQSGPGYPDQEELQWEDLGLEPEYTSVTKRKRRLFSWSRIQFRESVAANRPDLLFLNFVQYLKPDKLEGFIYQMLDDYRSVFGYWPGLVLLGYGPKSEDVRLLDWKFS